MHMQSRPTLQLGLCQLLWGQRDGMELDSKEDHYICTDGQPTKLDKTNDKGMQINSNKHFQFDAAKLDGVIVGCRLGDKTVLSH